MGEEKRDKVFNNRYKVVKELGRGGMGHVFLVEDILKDNMLFALKTIRQDLIADHRESITNSIRNEYEIMTKLKHPNLVRIYELGEEKELYYLIVEYLKGKMLSESIIKSMDERMDIIVHILRALEYIHSRNIVYKDIKPDNIMILDDIVKLMDFGISGFIGKKENKIKGTFSYISPDALFNDINFSMDIFSLGIVLFELIADIPFYDFPKNKIQTIIKLLSNADEFITFQENRLKLVANDPLREIILKMTSYDNQKRYASCMEVISDINEKLDYDYEYETSETRGSYVLGNAFVNRTEELGLLRENLNKTERDKFVFFSGPSGIGKSRLFFEFKRYCRLNDISFFESNCMEGVDNQYHSISEIISKLINITSPGLLKKYGKYLKYILPKNNRIIDHECIEQMDNPKLFQDILVQNISDYIFEIAYETGKDCILYFDDAHWIDSGSGYILKNIFLRLKNIKDYEAKVLVYGNYDEMKLDKGSWIIDMLEKQGMIKYPLQPLGIDIIFEYFGNIFGRKALDISIKEAVIYIREKIGGNPLFLELLLKSLVDNELIIRDKEYWKLVRPIDELDIPDNILDIINEKLERLFKDANKEYILNILSLLRIDMDIERIKKLMDNIHDNDIAGLLLELENLEILQSKSIDNITYYSLSNTLLKQQIRENIQNRSVMSLFVASKLEEIAPEYLEEIAYQYLEGNDIEKAVYYYKKCGEISEKNYFNRQAIKYYDLSLQLIRKYKADISESILLSLKTANILFNIGNWRKAEKVYNESINLAKGLKSRHILAEAFIGYGWLKYSMGSYNEALVYYQRSREIFEELDDKKGIGMAAGNIGNIYFAQDEYLQSLVYYQEFLEIFTKIGDKQAIGMAYGNMGNVYYRMGNYKKALEYYENKKKISEDMGDKKAFGKAVLNIGNSYEAVGKYSKALFYYRIYKRIADEIGDKRGLGIAMGNIGIVYHRLGQYAKALECYVFCREISQQLGDKRGIGIACGNIGNTYEALIEYDKALEYYKYYKRIADEIGDKKSIGVAAGNMANLYNKMGQYSKAILFYKIHKTITEMIGDKKGVGISAGNMGNAYEALGQYEKSIDCYDLFLRVSKEIGFKQGIADALASLGSGYYHQKDYKRSIRNLEKAIGIYYELKSKSSLFIECLFIKCTILIVKQDMEKAKKCIGEALNASSYIKNDDFILCAKAIKNIIDTRMENKHSESSISKILSNGISEERKADIYYLLFIIDNNDVYRDTAVKLYSALFEKNQKFKYRSRMDELS